MKESLSNIKFVWSYAKKYKWKFFVEVLLDFFSIGLYVLGPIVSAQMIISLTENDLNRLFLLALAILSINFFVSFINFICSYIMRGIFKKNLVEIQDDLSKAILTLDNKIMDENSSGLFIQRLTSDTNKLADIFAVIDDYIYTIISNIGIFVSILIVNKYMFLYSILISIILIMVSDRNTKMINEKDKIVREKSEKITGFIGELVRGARDIKMLNSESSFQKEMHKRSVDYNESEYEKNITRNARWLLYNSLEYIFTFLSIVLMIYLIRNDLLTITSALIIFNYFEKVTNLSNYFGYFLEYIKNFNLSSERIKEVLDNNKFKKEKFGNVHLDKVEGNFEFKDVTFRYEKNGRKILDKLSFKINANETVAFVGKTGTGKTTIFNLLCKMYEINSGKIFIDGIDLKKLDKDSIRGNITIINQNPYIFNVSIKDNIKLVKEDVSDEEIKSACKAACLDKFIEKLPKKYDTIVGEGGITLSGGEKQRLAIARALVQKTEIILFDEATSALDNETQNQIQKAIDNMKNEYTILIIAHRLSTIINADRIVFIDEGKVVDEGTHKELMRKCKEYKELYNSEIKSR